MEAKKPRRTAERILEVTLDLFNRFGEPNVSTTLISVELRISPGNLYYHYPAKEELINALVDRYENSLQTPLQGVREVSHIEDTWRFFRALFEAIWQYRFLYRDLNDLLSKNHRIETHFKAVIAHQSQAIETLLKSLQRQELLHIEPTEMPTILSSMMVMLTYWLSYEYVRDPRNALEPENASATCARGAWNVLTLLGPYLVPAAREKLRSMERQHPHFAPD